MAHALSLIAEYRGVYLNAKNPDMCVAFPIEKPFGGARILAQIPPVTQAPSMTIRKHLKRDIVLQSYVDQGILSQDGYDYLINAIKDYKNIIVSGQPKSGKTTLTLALLSEIPKASNSSDRILVLEDTPELIVPMEDVEYMATSQVRNMTQLVKNAMSMRPDRIIVGEVTDKAALAMLKSWNTGCPGGVSTLHANNTLATCQRLVDLACENNIPEPISLITTTVNVLVHIERSPSHKSGRKITEISELTGYDRINGHFTLNPIIHEKRK